MWCRGLLLVVLFGTASPTFAQPVWVATERTGGFHAEYLRPDIEGSSAASGAVYLGVRAPVGSHVALVGELPLAHGDFDLGNVDLKANTTLGNPYVGVELGPRHSSVHFEIGARLPVLKEVDAASSVGFLADPVDRPEAFLEDLLAVSAVAHYRRFGPGGFGWMLHGGATAWLTAEESDRDAPVGTAPPDDEIVAHYGARFGWRGRTGGFLAGVTGRANVSDPNGSFGDRARTQIAGAGYLRLGPVRPGLEFRLPLDDDLREIVDGTIGVSLVIAAP